MRHRVLAAIVLFVFVSTPILAQKTGNQFMWKVEGADGSSAYLLGSLHVLTAEFYPLSATINKAFAESKTLVEEVDIDEMNDPMVMMAALSKAMLTDGRTLDQVIAPELFAEVKKRAEKTGMPMMALQRMKPWLVAITLMAPTLQAAGFKPELGIDQHFFDRAKDSGMKRQGLETMAFQLDQFDSMSPKLQEEMLRTTMEDLDKEVAGITEMAQAWSFGNVAAVEKMTLEEMKEVPELYQRLLVDRNRNWIPHVEACIKQNSACFIVVGAAHLVGPDGLPTLLSKKGYKVTQQ
jgi:uncharacterized protein YbaP (TraB family)